MIFMPDNITPVERPRFLTFICMLTFLSAISGLWTQADSLWSPGVTADRTRQYFETFQEGMETQNNQESAKMLEPFFDSIYDQLTTETMQLSAIIMLVYESLTLFGAYLMWGLQKRGFYLYLAGIAVAILGPIVLIGGWLGGMTAFGGAFFSVIFAFLYRSQLKHMY